MCSTHFANSERPESINSLDENYKRYRFPHILNEGVELENLALRQKLGGLQEKFDSNERIREADERVHKVILGQLDLLQKHNLTLEKHNQALEITNAQLRALVGKYKSSKHSASTSPVVERQSGSGMELDDLVNDQGTNGRSSCGSSLTN